MMQSCNESLDHDYCNITRVREHSYGLTRLMCVGKVGGTILSISFGIHYSTPFAISIRLRETAIYHRRLKGICP
jgi:hypothetical protein